jgi:hypothetical protein
MELVKDYLRRAQECEVLAATAATPQQKAQIALIAGTWRKLAKEREEYIKAKSEMGR